MCGIVAVITKHTNGFSYKQLQVFETLLWLDTLRGNDSTGVFCVNNMGNCGIAKEIGPGEYFLSTPEWKDYRGKMFSNGWAIVGHNRKATRGSVSDKNAHPFWVEDKLVLVHNGSFMGSHKHLKDTDVDSEAIAHTLVEHGADDVAGALKRVNAAYALSWYDVDNKTINFIRNTERPLHWVETSDAYYFCSEKDMLEFALKRNDITWLKNVYMFPEYSLNKYKLGDNKQTTTDSLKLDCKYEWKSNYTSSYKEDDHYHMGHPFQSAWGNSESCSIESDEAWERSIRAAIRESREREEKAEEKQVQEPIVQIETTKETKREVTKITDRTAQDINIPIFPWFKQYTMPEFEQLKSHYPDKARLQVIVDDYVPPQDAKEKYIQVFGKTLDNHNIPVTFKVTRDLLSSIIDSSYESTENAVFEVTLNSVHWKRTSKHDVSHEKAQGLMIINAVNPLLRFDGKGVGHA